MKTKALSLVLMLAIMVSAFGLETGARAQTTTVSGGAAVSAGVAAPLSAFDADRSDDTITQLNNLQIQSLGSGSLPTVITAYSDPSFTCTGSPCPLYPSRLYSIRVSSETILLQKNRARTSFSQLRVGDMINVYGFQDQDTTQNLDALILRDLSLPRQQQYVQLNNVQVVSQPSSPYPPATLVVVRSSYPCYGYGMYGTSARSNIACPLGFTDSAKVSGAANIAIDPAYFPQQKYLIQVNASTVLYDKNRNRMSLCQIQNGDNLNIYGVISSDNTTVTALVLRDLSAPHATTQKLDITTTSNLRANIGTNFGATFTVSGGSAPYTISTDGSDTIPGMTLSQAKPCPPGMYCAQMIDPNSVYLTGTPTVAGSYQIVISAHDNPPQIYCITTPCPQPQASYGKATFKFVVSGPTGTGQAPVIESVGGPSSLAVGATGTFSVTARDPEGGPLTYGVRWGDEPIYMMSAPGANIRMPDETRTTAGLTHVYTYSGTYIVTFMVTDNHGLSTQSTLTVNVR